jgi:hypothetical protein
MTCPKEILRPVMRSHSSWGACIKARAPWRATEALSCFLSPSMQSPVLVTLPKMGRSSSELSASSTFDSEKKRNSFDSGASAPDVLDALEAQVHDVQDAIEQNIKFARVFWRRFKGEHDLLDGRVVEI